MEFDTSVVYIILKNTYKPKTKFKMAGKIIIDQIIWMKQNYNFENKSVYKPKKKNCFIKRR
jgi:hypothetical protein